MGVQTLLGCDFVDATFILFRVVILDRKLKAAGRCKDISGHGVLQSSRVVETVLSFELLYFHLESFQILAALHTRKKLVTHFRVQAFISYQTDQRLDNFGLIVGAVGVNALGVKF